jgi:hemoglobin
MDEDRDIYVPPGGPGPLPPLSSEIYQSMGEAGVFHMLEDFYAELGQSSIRHLFSEDLLAASQRSAAFYVQLLGGPPLYNQQYGNPMMRRRHFPFVIDEPARQVWVGCFHKTLENAARYGFPPAHLESFKAWLNGFSRWMVNSKAQDAGDG